MAQHQVVESQSKSTLRGRNDALKSFGYFTVEAWGMTTNEVIQSITDKSLDVYAVLSDFAMYMCFSGVGGGSQRTYMTHVRQHIVTQTDVDITKDKFNIKVKPQMGKLHKHRDGELTNSDAARIISAMPEKMKLLCVLEACTLRRPHEINHLRVCDIHFTDADNKPLDPVEITIPSYISKNNVGGRTFCTKEATNMLKSYIKKYNLKEQDRLFTYTNTQTISSLFIENLHRQLPDMRKKMDNGRYAVHLYSLKKYGYSIVKYNISKEFANDLKGDLEEYDRLEQRQRRKLYKKVESKLIIFNQDILQTELEETGEDTNDTKAVLDVLVQALKSLNNPDVNSLLNSKIGDVIGDRKE